MVDGSPLSTSVVSKRSECQDSERVMQTCNADDIQSFDFMNHNDEETHCVITAVGTVLVRTLTFIAKRKWLRTSVMIHRIPVDVQSL